jgi:hypothetical protein
VEVPNALLSHSMEEGWLVVSRGMVMVGQLDEQVALQGRK